MGFPSFNIYLDRSHTYSHRKGSIIGIAAQKGIYFTICGNLFGRDGLSRMVKKQFNCDNCCEFIMYALLIRFLAIFDILQFLIFGTIMFACTILVFVSSLIACIFLPLCSCNQKIKLKFKFCALYCYCSFMYIFVNVLLYILLPFEIILPELLFKVFEIEKWGHQVREDLP